MIARSLLNACHTYYLGFLHALACFGLGMEGVAAMDHNDFLGMS